MPKVRFAALLEPPENRGVRRAAVVALDAGACGQLLLVLAGAVAGLEGAYAGAQAGLDAALCRRLAAMAQGPSMQRVTGARRLLRMQALLLAAQAGALAVAGIWADVACLQPIRRPVIGARIRDGPVSVQ